MADLTDWLLAGSPWVEYRTRIDLLGQNEDDPAVIKARGAMLAHPLVTQLVNEVSDWPGSVLNSHKSAGHPIHKLVFLADLGLNIKGPGIQKLSENIMQHQDPA
jgi:hypothetical protein